MKKIALMTVALALASSPALAQNEAALCKLWSANKSAASRPAAYQPGVDVHGRPVVPADGGAGLALPESIRIPVTVDLAQKLGAAIPAGTTMEAIAGIVNIGGDGRVTYNGQDLTQATVSLCSGQHYAAEPAPMADPNAAYIPPAAQSLGTLPAPAVQPRLISAQTADPDAAYVPPAIVPATNGAPMTRPSALGGGGAVHTPSPAPSIVDEHQQGDLIWGEGN